MADFRNIRTAGAAGDGRADDAAAFRSALNRGGLVMETMAALSRELLTPAVYDVTQQGKGARDETSAAMPDPIYGHKAFDLNTILDLGGSSILLRACVPGGQENCVSACAGIKKAAHKNLHKFVAFAKGE